MINPNTTESITAYVSKGTKKRIIKVIKGTRMSVSKFVEFAIEDKIKNTK